MLSLLGEYIVQLDPKSRLRLPAPLCMQLSDVVGRGFVLNRGFERCLTLFPRHVWDNITTELQKLDLYTPKHREFVRYFFRGATELTLDNQQRLLVPSSLAEYAQLQKIVVVFAYFNRIELWAKEQYDQLFDNEPSDFSALAEDIMSKIR